MAKQETKKTMTKGKKAKSEDKKMLKLKEKISTLQSKMEKLTQKVEQMQNASLLKTADLENYKKRQEKELSRMLLFTKKATILSFIKLLDDLNRTLQISHDKAESTFVEGIEMVVKNFEKTLQSQNVTPIESLGKPFDHELHEAVMTRKEKDAKPHIVLEEFEKGYMLNDEVLRHAKVVVSQ